MAIPVRLGFEWLEVGHCDHLECLMRRDGAIRTTHFPSFVGLLIHPQRGPMLFDTGYSDAFFTATDPFPERLYRLMTPVVLPDDQRLERQLARLGYVPDDIDRIFVSHVHADHVAGLGAFPRARLTIMRAELDAMRGRSRIGRLRRAFLSTLLPADLEARASYAEDTARVTLPSAMRPFTEGFDLLGDSSIVGIPLPGHSQGQMGLLFTTTADRMVLLAGDACWSLEAVRADQPPGRLASILFADKQIYLRTFEALRRLSASHPALHILPSHCAESRDHWVDASA